MSRVVKYAHCLLSFAGQTFILNGRPLWGSRGSEWRVARLCFKSDAFSIPIEADTNGCGDPCWQRAPGTSGKGYHTNTTGCHTDVGTRPKTERDFTCRGCWGARAPWLALQSLRTKGWRWLLWGPISESSMRTGTEGTGKRAPRRTAGCTTSTVTFATFSQSRGCSEGHTKTVKGFTVALGPVEG